MSARAYLSIPAPLRLAAEDVRCYSEAVTGWLEAGRVPRVLILGVTPEFLFMPWPAGTSVLAVDRSEHMIREVWAGEPRQAMCAEWGSMPLPDRSRDLVFCDGGLSFLHYPDGLVEFARNLRRIVAPGGLLVTRIYDPGPDPEDPGQVMADFLAGRVANSAILKLRLAMALSTPPTAGVVLDSIWRFYEGAVGDPALLPALTGWDKAEVRAIEAYAGKDERYCFPTTEEVLAVMCESPGGFECLGVVEPACDFHEHLRFVTLAPV